MLDRADMVEMLGCSSWCKACTAGSRLDSFYPADAGVTNSEAPAVRGPRGTGGAACGTIGAPTPNAVTRLSVELTEKRTSHSP